MHAWVSQRFFQLTVVLFLSVGLIGFLYSLKLTAYKNETFYQTEYMSIAVEPSTQEAFKHFHTLRDNQLTSKYKIQDYSLTFLVAGIILFVYLKLGGNKITAFQSKKKIIFLGICTVLINSSASLFSLMLDFHRGEFPWWADTLAIPIFTQELPLLLILMIWVFIHFLFLKGNFQCGKEIFRLNVLKANYWLSFIIFISFIFLLNSFIQGSFMMIVPWCLWIYFYLSLASGRNNN